MVTLHLIIEAVSGGSLSMPLPIESDVTPLP
jgi:hypothetical protein